MFTNTLQILRILWGNIFVLRQAHFYLLILVLAIWTLSFPDLSYAARQCPANLIGPDVSQGNACISPSTRQIVGTALDPNEYPCPLGSVPMLTRSSVNACANPNGQLVNMTGPNVGEPAGDQSGIPSKQPPENSGCTWWNFPSQPVRCLFAPFVSGLAGILLGLSGQILQLCAYLFDLLVFKVIVTFGDTVKTLTLIDGVHTAWTALRDISNIVIIGMFTFIAISIIIGNHTYGEKKLVAKVLIVAVLINFSLLFSKIIIDASNFVAWQVYKSMAPQGSGTASGGNIPAGTGGNISGKFLAIVGATTIFKGIESAVNVSSSAITAGENRGEGGISNSLAGAAKGIFYALIGSVLLLVASGVLLYGSYLIAARAVLLVFLMLVSALAFASYLVPKLAGGEYGWSTWWKSLINASIFGPLLMILLYVSLVIITPAAKTHSGGSFGKIASDPTALKDENSWGILAVFVFGIGMLYISIKVANSFASRIAGFSTAGTISMAPVVGASRLGGFLGRSIGGRAANWGFGRWQKSLTDRQAEENKKTPWGKEPRKVATRLDNYGLRTLNMFRKGTMDAINTGIGKRATALTGAPGFGGDWGKGGYVGTKKRQSDHAAHIGHEMAEDEKSAKTRLVAAEAGKIRGEAVKELEEINKGIRHVGDRIVEQTRESRREDSEILAKEISKVAAEQSQPSAKDAERDEHGALKPTQAQNNAAAEERARSAMRERGANIAEAASTASQKAKLETLGESQAGKLAELGAKAEQEAAEQQEARISELKKTIEAIDAGRINDLSAEHKKRLQDAEHAAHAAHDVAVGLAEVTAKMTPGAMFPLMTDKSAAEGIAAAMKKQGDEASMKKLIQELSKGIPKSAAAPAAAAQPSGGRAWRGP